MVKPFHFKTVLVAHLRQGLLELGDHLINCIIHVDETLLLDP